MKKANKIIGESKVEEPNVVYGTTIASGNIPFSYKNMISDDQHLIQSANKGIAATAITEFSKFSGKTKEEIANWIYITPKTVRSYEATAKKLPTLQSELLLKLYMLYDKGITVFGNAQAFNEWLALPSFGLYHQTPESLLTTITGMSMVQDELTRISYGDFA